MIQRRTLLSGAAAIALGRTARASQTLTLLVGGQAGAPTEVQARAFIPLIMRQIPATTVEMKVMPGDAGMVALRALEQAPRNGSVLGWVATPELSARIVDHGVADLMQRVTLLGAIEEEPITIVAPAATRFSSVQDIITSATANAGGAPLGTPPPGSPPHLAALRLQALAAARLQIITFPSSATARQAAVNGKVAAAALGLSSAIDDLRAGRLMGLGIAASNPVDAYPEMPSLLDSGIDLSAAIRRGLAAPAGLSDDIRARLAHALERVVEDADFRQQADAAGFVATWVDGGTWTDQVRDERADLARLWATEPWRQLGSS